MNQPILSEIASSAHTNLATRSHGRRCFLFIPFALACLALTETALADPNEGDRGNGNTSEGFQALFINTTGTYNTAIGFHTLFTNMTGGYNTATGSVALLSNTTGSDNTADGFGALHYNTTGSGNIALGGYSGLNLTTGNNNIDIGHPGVAGESNTIRIGGGQQATFVAGISGTPVVGAQVVVDFHGQLGNLGSSLRFKDEIKPMDTASEAILALRPVTFRYKHEIDPSGIPQFGLVAEEVEKVNPDLVGRDAQGKVFSVRYEAVNAMLLNEGGHYSAEG
jgi:hypothetical protein